MTKNEYLKKLRRALRRVKRDEREKSLAYFSELIDDRIEDGIPEQKAVAELESVGDAAERIIAEAGVLEQLKPKHSVWEILLLILGFPLWFPLLLAVAIVVLTMYGLVWILIGALFVSSVSLVLGGTAAVCSLFFAGNLPTAALSLGVGLVCAGLGLALFIPALFFARGYAKATPIMVEKLKFRSSKGGADTHE